MTMTTRRLVHTGLQTLARYPLRSSFIMLATLVGVAALTLVVSLGAAAERRVLETLRRNFNPSSIVVSRGGPLLVGGGPGHDAAHLSIDDAVAVAATVQGIEAWDPIFSLEGLQVRRGDATAVARVIGNSERAPRVWSRDVVQGEYFDAAHVSSSARVAVLGVSTARALFGGDDPVGSDIQVGNVSVRVIGVLEPIGTDAHGNDRDAELALPYTTVMRRLANTDSIGGVRLIVRDAGQVESVGREVRTVLRERHGLATDRADDFTLLTPIAVAKLLSRVRGIFTIFLPLIAAVALLAGAAVAASVTLLSVSERTGEIGLRRALGARPRDIALQLLVETTVTTVLGGFGGAALGVAATLGIAAHLRLGTSFSWPAVLLGLVLAAVIGVAASILPARRAARLHPVEALK
jgi:putative ABC transport system permease protein